MILLSGLFCIVIISVFYLAWQNLSWMVQNSLFQEGYDKLGAFLNSHVEVTIRSPFGTPLLTHNEKSQLIKGQIIVLNARQAINLAQKENNRKPQGILIIANTPGDFFGLDLNQRSELLLQTTLAAIKLNARIIIDCSSADLARMSSQGLASLSMVRKHKIIRVVIFDGGHHLPALALNPDLIIAPVAVKPTGEEMIIHGYVKDALPLKEVMGIANQLGLSTGIATVPRWGTVAKTRTTMAGLAVTSLLKQTKNTPVKPSPTYNIKVYSSQRPVISLGYTAMTAVTPQPNNLQNILEQTKKAGTKNLYLALLYPTHSSYRKVLDRFLTSANKQGLNVKIVTQPYNAVDLLRLRFLHIIQRLKP